MTIFNWKNWITLVGLGLFAGLVLVVATGLLETCIIWLSSRPAQIQFDKESWNEWQEQDASEPLGESSRQQMIRSLVTDFLPGLDNDQVEELLGQSPTHEDLRSGESYAYEEHDWDLLYMIGSFASDWFGGDAEFLLLRFDKGGKFESWYIVGSNHWKVTAGRKAAATFRGTR